MSANPAKDTAQEPDDMPEPGDHKADKPNPLNKVDLTSITPICWPSNAPVSIATQYVNVHRIKLNPGQSGLFLSTPEGFVFERIDVHIIRPIDQPFDISFHLEDDTDLGAFSLKDDRAICRSHSKLTPGSLLSEKNIYIRNYGKKKPEGAGRIAITFHGYQIEAWR